MPVVTSFPTGGLDDVYFLEQRPPVAAAGIASDVIGAVITANRGPLNVPLPISTPNDLALAYGDLTDGLSGYYDLLVAMQQGASTFVVVRVAPDGVTPASMTITNSTAQALIYLEAAAPGNMPSPGTWGNTISVVIGAGSVTGTTRLSVTRGREINVIDNLDLTTTTGITAAIAAINGNATLVRASQPVIVSPTAAPTLATATTGGTAAPNNLPATTYYVSYSWTNAAGQTLASAEGTITVTGTAPTLTVTPGSPPAGTTGYNIYGSNVSGSKGLWKSVVGTSATVLVSATDVANGGAVPPVMNTATTAPGFSGTPTLATVTLAGGVNGTVLTSATYLGGTTTNGNTGLVALTSAVPAPSIVFLGTPQFAVGGAKPATQGGADSTTYATMISTAKANNWIAILTAPQGTSQTVMQTINASNDSDFYVMVYPWQIDFEPTLYQANIYTSPLGVYAGLLATLPLQVSPGNKNVQGVTNAEFNLSRSQMTALVDPGVRVVPVGQPIPRGGIGIYSGKNGSSNTAINDVSRRRIATYIERSLDQILTQYVDEPNNTVLQDLVTQSATNFLQDLAAQGMIGDASGLTPGYFVRCDGTNNTPSSLAQGLLYVDVQVMTFASAQQIRIRFEIGPTVVLTQV